MTTNSPAAAPTQTRACRRRWQRQQRAAALPQPRDRTPPTPQRTAPLPHPPARRTPACAWAPMTHSAKRASLRNHLVISRRLRSSWLLRRIGRASRRASVLRLRERSSFDGRGAGSQSLPSPQPGHRA
eukprot:6206055-Pleurochrysis_carterae.AAC.2